MQNPIAPQLDEANLFRQPAVVNLALAAGGLTVKVQPFAANDGYFFAGGSIKLPINGVWFIGPDLFSGELIALPRLGHRGWVPVARVTTTTTITDIQQIKPQVPASRLPRTMRKILDNKAINVLVLGSSLAEGGGLTDWSGMLFNSSSSVNLYKIPGTITFNNYALGGTPNQYQLAQVGLASEYDDMDYSEAGFPLICAGKAPPNGRSTMFSNVDLVVLTLLANGGDYRLECIEPIVRNLRKMGIEVLLTTDNAQGAPFTTYTDIINASLYVDGPYVKNIADLYNCEFADTAAYVAGAELMYPAVAIYRDSIHMQYSTPTSRVGTPTGGYEVWARCLRSTLSVDASLVGTTVLNYNFDDGTTQGWSLYNNTAGASVVNSGNSLLSTNGPGGGQFGAQVTIPIAFNAGDIIRIQGTASKSVQVGLQYGGWDSTVSSTSVGTFDTTITANNTRAAGTGIFIFYGGSTANDSFTVDNLVITVNSSYVSSVVNKLPHRTWNSQLLPASRIVTDLQTPGDAFIILPADEYHYKVSSNAGVLSASPLGASSFARRFSSAVGSTNDLLTLTTGQRASLPALGVVGFSLIYYSVNGDPQVTFDIYKNNSFQKTVTIAAQTISREIYLPIYTPTQQAKADIFPINDVIDIRVTSGTLRIAALVALTFEMDVLAPEAASRIGTWTAKVQGGAPSMMGYATDTANDYAVIQCPPGGRRITWLISSKPNSKPVHTWSGRTITSNEACAGVNHVCTRGSHLGPGEFHYIKLVTANTAVDQSTNGYGLHYGGIIVIYDR